MKYYHKRIRIHRFVYLTNITQMIYKIFKLPILRNLIIYYNNILIIYMALLITNNMTCTL